MIDEVIHLFAIPVTSLFGIYMHERRQAANSNIELQRIHNFQINNNASRLFV